MGTTNLLITITLLTTLNALGTDPTMWLYAAFNVAAWHAGRFTPSDFQQRATTPASASAATAG